MKVLSYYCYFVQLILQVPLVTINAQLKERGAVGAVVRGGGGGLG